MIIRKMLESDLAEVMLIEKGTFSEPWNKEDFCSSISNSNNGYLVAVIQESIVGYCGYWGIAGEGYIYNVAVKKEFQRRNIGIVMMKKLMKQAPDNGIGNFTLEVRLSNKAAISLYKRLGFEQAGIRKDFYTKPKEDGIIMWWKPIQ